MAYQIESILKKCDHDDLKILIEQLDNYFAFTDDRKMKE